MSPPVDTKDPTAVEVQVQAAYLKMFPGGDPLFVPRAFGWFLECFSGKYGEYQAVDVQYHDLEHTLQGTLCMIRLLHGRHEAGAEPRLTAWVFQLGVLAILLHDSGYLKKRGDITGTGAKYTITHVSRSADFAAELLQKKGFGAREIQAVQNMICCTGINAKLTAIPFQSEIERITGYALATGDLLGQMAAEDYIDKLPTLYAEFAEATNYSGDHNHFVATFSSAEDLIEKTPRFWQHFVLRKLDHDFGSLYKFLSDPYPSGPNYYLDRITANMDNLKQRLGVF